MLWGCWSGDTHQWFQAYLGRVPRDAGTAQLLLSSSPRNLPPRCCQDLAPRQASYKTISSEHLVRYHPFASFSAAQCPGCSHIPFRDNGAPNLEGRKLEGLLPPLSCNSAPVAPSVCHFPLAFSSSLHRPVLRAPPWQNRPAAGPDSGHSPAHMSLLKAGLLELVEETPATHLSWGSQSH